MPHSDETFYKMKCGWASDPKVATLARFGPVDACLMRDLFGQMIDYSRRELTDGDVPGEIVPQIAHPLPADEAMRLAMRLAEPGAFGPLCSWDAGRNAFRILAYAKWNDTREEVQARTEIGRNAARARWGANRNASRNANGIRNASDADRIDRARAQVHTEQEQEQEKTSRARPRASGEPREVEPSAVWSPSGVLDQQPARGRSIAERSPSSASVAAAMAHTRRPGGPATDEQRRARAEEARKGLANAQPRLGDPDPPADPTGRGLHGEALARAQLDQIAAERRTETALAAAAAVEGDPEDGPGSGEADNPSRADPEDFGELTEPADDEYPF